MEVPWLNDTQEWQLLQASPSGLRRLTIDGFGQDAGTGRFTYTPWTAKQKSMRQVVIADGIFQRSGNVFLPHNCIKGLGTVFSGRDNEFFHGEYLGDAACKVGKRARILGKPAPANAQSRGGAVGLFAASPAQGPCTHASLGFPLPSLLQTDLLPHSLNILQTNTFMQV
jgi:hypothetical protein